MSRADTGIFVLLRANIERISITFAGGNHHHRQQKKWLHFKRKCNSDKAAEYDKIFEWMSNRCCHL